MVTPRVEAGPDRYDFAKLGETKQFADDIRSQVVEKSRELAEMNEQLMALGDSPLTAHRKFLRERNRPTASQYAATSRRVGIREKPRIQLRL